jgi:hypothetical protein
MWGQARRAWAFSAGEPGDVIYSLAGELRLALRHKDRQIVFAGWSLLRRGCRAGQGATHNLSAKHIVIPILSISLPSVPLAFWNSSANCSLTPYVIVHSIGCSARP